MSWAKQIVGREGGLRCGFDLAPDGSSIISASFEKVANVGSPGEEQVSYEAAGYGEKVDIFLARFGPQGELRWSKKAGGTRRDNVLDVALFPDGSSIATGYVTHEATFGEGESGATKIGVPEEERGFVARFGPNGETLWATAFEGRGYDVVARADGSALLLLRVPEGGDAASASGAATLERGFHLRRLDASGQVVSTRRLATGTIVEHGLLGDRDGAVVLVADFRGEVRLGADVERAITLTAVGGTDLFVVRFDAEARPLWVATAGGPGPDSMTRAALPGDGGAVLVGTHRAPLTFGRGEPSEISLNPRERANPMSESMFIARFDGEGHLLWARNGD